MNYKTQLLETDAESIPCHMYESGELEIIHRVSDKSDMGLTALCLKKEQAEELYNLLKSHFAPLEVKEQVRGEAEKWSAGMYDVHNGDTDKFEPTYLTQEQIDEYKRTNKWFKPVTPKASNPELGVEEAAENYATNRWLGNIADKKGTEFYEGCKRINRPEMAISKKDFIAGANWQATQQQGLVSLEGVIELMENRIIRLQEMALSKLESETLINENEYMLIKLKTLKQ